MRHRPRPPSLRELGFVAVWLASALLLLRFVDRGWIPADEGLLGQTAERVLGGELPHRDFGDTYTGGLAFLHALAFRLAGVRLVALRWLLYGAALLFVPAFYLAARRAAGPWPAAAVAFLAVVWSLPNYFAALPSWYNLFLATLGTLALFKLIETGRRRWAFAAGLAAGASLALKSIGLLQLAATLLFLVYREGRRDEAARDEAGRDDGPPAPRALGFPLFASGGLLTFVAVLIVFFSQRASAMAILLFVVPGATLAGVALVETWTRPSTPAATRLGRLASEAGAAIAGATLPMLALLAPYLRDGTLEAWTSGELLFPRSRLDFAAWTLPPPLSVVTVLPLGALFLLPRLRAGLAAVERRALPVVALGLAAVAATAGRPLVYQSVWYALRPLAPLLALLGAAALLRRPRLAGDDAQRLFAVLAMTSLFSTIQFTYSLGIYFCYAAPLVILAYLFVAQSEERAPRRLHGAVLVFFAAFALLWMHGKLMQGLGVRSIPIPEPGPLGLARAGLRVPPGDAEVYRAVVGEVERRSRAGSAVVCLPDCPEIPFLADRRNPTPTLYDFLDRDYGRPERVERILSTLREERVDVVVIDWRPGFSALPPELPQALSRRYPRSRSVDPFTVHWREPPPAGSPGD